MHAARPSLLVLKGERISLGGADAVFRLLWRKLYTHFCQNRQKLLTRLRHRVCRRKGQTHTLSHTHTRARPLHPLTCPKNSSVESITLFSHYHVSLGHLDIKARVWDTLQRPLTFSLSHIHKHVCNKCTQQILLCLVCVCATFGCGCQG